MVREENQELMKTGRGQLPEEVAMDRKDALNAFVAAVNLANPEHSILDERLTSITPENVKYGVTRSYHARCGPRHRHVDGHTILIKYSTRTTYINKITRAQHLALLAHEMSHLKYHSGSNEGGGTHTDRFWDEYAFNASELRDAVVTSDTVFGDVSDTELCEAIVDGPNPSTVDRRQSSVQEIKTRIAELIGEPQMAP